MQSVRPSPASRCPDDHLSPAFSFLNTAEFALAIGVSKQWRRIGSLCTAWPEHSLDRLINSSLHRELRRFPFTGPRLDLVLPLRVPSAAFEAVVESLLRSELWTKHASHLRLRGSGSGWADDPEALLPLLEDRLPSLSRLRSLALQDVSPHGVGRLFTALAPRLEALSLSCVAPSSVDWTPVGLLTNLRVLSLLFPCTAPLVSPLHRLKVLHWSAYLGDTEETRECFVAIRRLSVDHRLRTFRFENLSSPCSLDLAVLSRERDDGLAPAAFTEVSIIAATFVPVVLQLPAVVSAEFGARRWHTPSGAAELFEETVSRSIKHLRIFDDSNNGLWSCPELGSHVPALESLDLDQQHIGRFNYEFAWFTQLRELRVGCGRKWFTAKELGSLCSLSQFRQLLLRVHPLHSTPSLTLADLKAISRSASFRRLVCVLTEEAFGQSSTVSELSIGDQQPASWSCRPSFTLKALEAQALSEFEVHVRSHAGSECAIYALRPMNAASATRLQWKRMDQRCRDH